MTELTHFDQAGNAHMVDVGAKDQTHRVARAQGFIRMKPETFAMIAQGTAKKGDVIGIARVAAIMASKRTSDLVPLCHPIGLTRVAVDFELDEKTHAVTCTARCECYGKTGVEMEALHSVSVALLTIYDMCKALDKGMEIEFIHLDKKTGGKSGVYLRQKDITVS